MPDSMRPATDKLDPSGVGPTHVRHLRRQLRRTRIRRPATHQLARHRPSRVHRERRNLLILKPQNLIRHRVPRIREPHERNVRPPLHVAARRPETLLAQRLQRHLDLRSLQGGSRRRGRSRGCVPGPVQHLRRRRRRARRRGRRIRSATRASREHPNRQHRHRDSPHAAHRGGRDHRPGGRATSRGSRPPSPPSLATHGCAAATDALLSQLCHSNSWECRHNSSFRRDGP